MLMCHYVVWINKSLLCQDTTCSSHLSALLTKLMGLDWTVGCSDISHPEAHWEDSCLHTLQGHNMCLLHHVKNIQSSWMTRGPDWLRPPGQYIGNQLGVWLAKCTWDHRHHVVNTTGTVWRGDHKGTVWWPLDDLESSALTTTLTSDSTASEETVASDLQVSGHTFHCGISALTCLPRDSSLDHWIPTPPNPQPTFTASQGMRTTKRSHDAMTKGRRSAWSAMAWCPCANWSQRNTA